MTTAGGGVVIGLLGAGVVYLLAKGKEKADQLAEMEQGPLEQPGPPEGQGRDGRPPRRGPPRAGMPAPGQPPPAPPTQIAPQPPPTYPWQGGASLPLPEPHHYPHGYPPRQAPGPRYGAPAYPPQRPPPPAYPAAYPPAPRAYPHAPPPPPAPVRHAGAPAAIPGPPWVRATQADVNRDGVSDWYVGLLNSVRRPGYSEERTIGGRHWKLMVVSAAAHPELTSRVRDVLGWVMHGPARPAPPPPSLAHGAYPPARSPYPAPPQVAYHQPPQVPYGGGSAFAPSSWPSPSGGAPPWQQPGQPPPQQPPPHPPPPHPHHHDHPHDNVPHPTMAFAAPAPGGTGDCQNWKPASDADVHQDGVATVYQSMLSLPETTPPRIEVHKGRTWKFQVVTPTSDPSFGFAPGVTKSVRGWICADAPRPDTSDPGY
jgi:hypothetical protein